MAKLVPITQEVLIQAGWVEVKGEPGILFEKTIENRNPINDDPEDTNIKLIVHSFFNTPKLAVLFPDGGMLNFNVRSIGELNKFERQLDFYDCPY